MADDAKFLLLFLLLNSSTLCFSTEQDIQCLKSVQQSVTDPNGVLKSSWNFQNDTIGFICHFTGVQCWNGEENRVLSLRLGNLGLEGPFPHGLQDCTSMTGLDLSNNSFSGPIPRDISRLNPYLTYLDLSYNNFSGEIPESVANLGYLNVLNLQHNQLSGQIPPQFGLLTRITMFNVSDNPGLCASLLDDCPPSRKRWRPVRIRLHRLNDQSSIGAAVGFVVGFVMAFYFPRCFVCSERFRAYVVRI